MSLEEGDSYDYKTKLLVSILRCNITIKFRIIHAVRSLHEIASFHIIYFYYYYCQATGTGTGPGPGIGYWDWGWESGIGNWEWEMGKWKMEMGKWEIESTPSPRR